MRAFWIKGRIHSETKEQNDNEHSGGTNKSALQSVKDHPQQGKGSKSWKALIG